MPLLSRAVRSMVVLYDCVLGAYRLGHLPACACGWDGPSSAALAFKLKHAGIQLKMRIKNVSKLSSPQAGQPHGLPSL